ncbi:MAG: AAA family ATPase [Candidatus Freyarchaeota archaeon]|nr:AAA family ATPase [Candidatus Jordarchaeia archaeon]
MLKSLEIRNFKSIKFLDINCRKINIFIGGPNTGKSNILESLGIFSYGAYGSYALNGVRDFIRLERMSNLFYDENLDEKMEIKCDGKKFEMEFKNGRFQGVLRDGDKELGKFDYDHLGGGVVPDFRSVSSFKFYRFTILKKFEVKDSEFLLPPFGRNLLSVLMTHKELKSIASQIFEPFGLRLVFKPQEDKIEVLKQQEDVFIAYPYSLVSDTLQRIIFYLLAVNSNKDSILIFEEPEAHAFPYYTKFLAEKIALDKNNNQYFISTHNPYFLLSIIEKSPKEGVGIFITYFKDYQTRVKLLSEGDIEEIMDLDIDVFFNVERFLDEE